MADKSQQRPEQSNAKPQSPVYSEQLRKIRSAAAAILAPPYPELENDATEELLRDLLEKRAKVVILLD
jgi:hypothetical protein